MNQSIKFTLFIKVISTLIKKKIYIYIYIRNMINVTILKKKGCFVIAFGAVPHHVTSWGPMTSVVISLHFFIKHFFTF